MRLDKYLCDANIGTRSMVKTYIQKARISVNGETIKKPDYKVNEAKDVICFDGKNISYQEFYYYMLNKPSGVVSATEDNKEKTVLDLLPANLRKNISPVGRLDKDTVGLLLLTNDGQLSHNLLSPKKHVEKTYLVHCEKSITESSIELLEAGVDIGEKNKTLPAKIKKIDDKKIELTICEGKFHQVKRMLEAVDNKVLFLKRISFKNLQLDEQLAEGQWRVLTEVEIKGLKNE